MSTETMTDLRWTDLDYPIDLSFTLCAQDDDRTSPIKSELDMAFSSSLGDSLSKKAPPYTLSGWGPSIGQQYGHPPGLPLSLPTSYRQAHDRGSALMQLVDSHPIPVIPGPQGFGVSPTYHDSRQNSEITASSHSGDTDLYSDLCYGSPRSYAAASPALSNLAEDHHLEVHLKSHSMIDLEALGQTPAPFVSMAQIHPHQDPSMAWNDFQDQLDISGQPIVGEHSHIDQNEDTSSHGAAIQDSSTNWAVSRAPADFLLGSGFEQDFDRVNVGKRILSTNRGVAPKRFFSEVDAGVADEQVDYSLSFPQLNGLPHNAPYDQTITGQPSKISFGGFDAPTQPTLIAQREETSLESNNNVTAKRQKTVAYSKALPLAMSSRSPRLIVTPNKSTSSREVYQNDVPCKQCGNTFQSQDQLQRHHQKAHVRPFPCVFDFAGCDSTFATKNEWKRHVATKHLVLSYWLCVDGDCAHTKNDIKNNAGGHSTPTELPDGAIFNRKDLYTQHLKRMHQPEDVHQAATAKMMAKMSAHNPPLVKLKKEITQFSTAKWTEQIRQLQASCERKRCDLPRRMACPWCTREYNGPDAWDQRMEHVAKHLDEASKSSGTREAHQIPFHLGGINDRTLMEWATSPAVDILRRSTESASGWILNDPLAARAVNVSSATGSAATTVAAAAAQAAAAASAVNGTWGIRRRRGGNSNNAASAAGRRGRGAYGGRARANSGRLNTGGQRAVPLAQRRQPDRLTRAKGRYAEVDSEDDEEFEDGEHEEDDVDDRDEEKVNGPQVQRQPVEEEAEVQFEDEDAEGEEV